MRFMMRYASVLFLACLGHVSVASPSSEPEAMLLDQVIHGHEWKRVHAAEGLLAAARCRREIMRCFQQELKRSVPASPWRVGCLRVLHQTGLVDRTAIVEELVSIACNERAAGVVHAVETLGKLKVIIPDHLRCTLRTYLSRNNLLSDYARMVLAINGEETAKNSLQEKFAAGNMTAAFALFYVDRCPEVFLKKLVADSEDEARSPLFRAFAFRARAKHRGYADKDHSHLLACLDRESDFAALRFYLLALGDFQRPSDREYVSRWLNSDNDAIRIAASSAWLMLARDSAGKMAEQAAGSEKEQ